MKKQKTVSKYVSKTSGFWLEAQIALFIGVVLVANMVQTDQSFHGDYLGLIIEWCNPQQQDGFCDFVRTEHNQDFDSQLEIGDKYWDELTRQATFLIFIGIVIRMGIGFLIRKIRKISVTTIIMALIWGLIPFTLYSFSLIDTLYYWMAFEQVPQTLDWLDGSMVLQHTKHWFGTNSVEIQDLYATNVVGFGVLFFIIFLGSLVYNHSAGERRYIA